MIEHLEVDGVPVVHVRKAGPTSAGIVFRVGIADETLALSGVTHLVEHLALFDQALSDYHMNGTTTASHTHFFMNGGGPAAVGFLGSVCRALSGLPLHRVPAEKGILRTEEAGRGQGALSLAHLMRYGARGYGLPAYPEWGVHRLRDTDVAEWARYWFTRDNAVAWVSGETMPRDLRLPLPPGRRRPPPRAVPIVASTPAFFAEDTGAVVVEAVVRRSTAASVYSGVLQRAMFRSLRQEGGFSYTLDTAYTPRDRDHASLGAIADALPDKQDAVLGGMVDILAAMRVGRIDVTDLDAVRARADLSMASADADSNRLPAYAADLLLGKVGETVEDLRAELHAVTVEDLHRVALETHDSTLLQVPPGRKADWAGYTALPLHSPTTAEGTRIPSIDDPEIGLVIGHDGVSLVHGEATSTVVYDDCAVKLDWPDGARRLIGRDGFTVHIEPTLFGLDEAALAGIDAAVHPEDVVPMPPRPADRIPRPSATVTTSTPLFERKPYGTVVLAMFAGAVVLFALISTLATIDKPGPKGAIADWSVNGFFWLLAAAPIIALVRRQRRR